MKKISSAKNREKNADKPRPINTSIAPNLDRIGRPPKIAYETLIGQVYRNLTIVERIPHKKGYVCFACKCACGADTTALWTNIRRGLTTSCGCLMLKAVCLPFKEDAVINTLITEYKTGAKSRNFVFELTRERFIELIGKNCSYCGLPPSRKIPSKISNRTPAERARPKSRWPTILYTGIDRIDSNLGYVEGNVRPACFTCNFAKKNMPLEDFLNWVRRIYTHSLMLEDAFAA